jgi:hypothetical protein
MQTEPRSSRVHFRLLAHGSAHDQSQPFHTHSMEVLVNTRTIALIALALVVLVILAIWVF